MTKIWKSTLESIIVLATVSLVMVVVVLTVNMLLPAKTTFFNKDKLQKICPADSYSQLSDDDLSALGINLAGFNKLYKTAKVRAVIVAEGGTSDGNYIIESEGLGYNEAPIILYIAYNQQGEILDITDLFVDRGNTFWGDIQKHLDTIFDGLIGKSGDVGGGNDLLAGTGATYSMNGIARAVNIANALIPNLVGGGIVQPYQVTDTSVLANLRAITTNNAEFTCYPYGKVEVIDSVTTEVVSVYVSDSDEYIFETKSDAGTFGKTTLLVLVDTDNKTIKKINPLAMSAVNSDDHGVESEFLKDIEVLSNMFEGLNVSEISNMDKHLTGSTNATQTANGVKTALKAALENIDDFMQHLQDLEQAENTEETENPQDVGGEDND